MAQTKVAERGIFASLKPRVFPGLAGKIISGVSGTFILFQILWIGGILQSLGIFIASWVYRPVIVGIALALTYLIIPAKGSDRGRLPWYDIVGIMLSLLVSLYVMSEYFMVLQYGKKLALMPPSSPLEQVLGTIAILLILEGLRRTMGWILALIGGVFVFYPLFVNHMPGFLFGPEYSYQRLMDVLYTYPEAGIYGPFAHLFATILMGFLIFGAFFVASGAGPFFLNLSSAFLGHVRGGPAKVAVVASGFFGMISGSAAANVVSTGTITIPMMKRVGYKSHFAGAVEAVASTGGALAPPVMGAAAFIMMDFLGVSYLAIIIAAAVPAFLYYFALFMQVDFEAARTGLQGVPRSELPTVRKTLRDGWIYFSPIIFLLYFIGVLQYSAETSCIYTIGALLLVTLWKKEARMGPAKIWDALVDTTRGIPYVVCALSLAGLLTGVFSMTGLGSSLSSQLVDLARGNLPLLLVFTAAVCVILGMGLSATAVYLITALIMAPALVEAGIAPLAAHLFVFYFGLAAHITPPVCGTAYIAAALANAPFMKTGWTASRLGIATYIVPFIFVYSPGLLMQGTIGEIMKATLSSLVGVLFLAAGLGGYLLKKANWLERIGLMLAGGLALHPAVLTDVVGVALGGLLTARQWWQLRTSTKGATVEKP